MLPTDDLSLQVQIGRGSYEYIPPNEGKSLQAFEAYRLSLLTLVLTLLASLFVDSIAVILARSPIQLCAAPGTYLD